LPTARKLLTIKCDVDLPVRLEDLEPKPQDNARLAELFDRLEFRTWLKDLQVRGPGHEARGETESRDSSPHAPDSASAASPLTPHAAPARNYETILTDEQLRAWLSRIENAELTSIDTETAGLDPRTAQLVGISLSVEPGQGG